MANGRENATERRGVVGTTLRRFDSITSVTTGLLIYIACVFIFVMVITRYVFAYSDPSVELIARYMMIWATFLGVSCAVKSGTTIRFTLLEHMLSDRARGVVRVVAHGCALIISLGIAWSGIELVDETMMFNEVMPTALRWPIWIFRLSVAVGAILLVLQFLRVILEGTEPEPAEGAGV